MADMDFDQTIGIAPQFSSYALDERQVLLLSEQRSFRLTGKLYVALLPFLDGSRTGQAVVSAFEGRFDGARLRTILADMFAKGYITQLDGKAPRERQALWVELGLVPVEAETKLQRTSIGVMSVPDDGAAAEAAQALGAAARGTGLRVVAASDADLVVVSVEDYLHGDLAALNRQMRRDGRDWALFKAGGSMPLVGPVFHADAAPCWACLSRPMIENRPGDTVLAGGTVAARPARGGSPATRSLAANFAAFELARAAAGKGLASLDRSIIAFDLKARICREHFVRLEATCPVCGPARDAQAALERASRPIVLASRPVLPQTDGGWRSVPTAEVMQGLERYVSPLTGIIADLDDCSPGDGLPVFRARQAKPVQADPRHNRLLGQPGGAAGKGMSEAQAKVSCLAEAMERYLCGHTGHEPRRRARWAELAERAPHPVTCLNFSERQYDTRTDWNARHHGFNWVAERFDDSRAIDWTPAWSLTHGESRWLPTRYCYFNYADALADKDGENVFCIADSNGCASGSTLEEAILQGLLELVERDACALWWYNRARRPAFDLRPFDSPFLRRVQALCSSQRRGLHVLDLTTDLGIPVAIALSWQLDTGKSIALGLGAHLDGAIAVNRALSELNQMLALETALHAQSDDKARKATGDEAAMIDWIRNKSLETEPYCVSSSSIGIDAYATPRVEDLKQAVELGMRAVSDRGYDMIVLDHSRLGIDFAAARVVVPGLRHFWARFREGRLYTAPVEMGWLPRPLIEEQLNPIPFFM
jgi:bacteriocin biosynthesis cyclodehydratase domain-containing protein